MKTINRGVLPPLSLAPFHISFFLLWEFLGSWEHTSEQGNRDVKWTSRWRYAFERNTLKVCLNLGWVKIK
ncbi:hypothetical protein HanXRQr2_Chr09g0381491 [Helianthus annuus]|uniref:Uncharacterized protein n=1 Tax=Helianthus annuus TaxID=4232 RepID=A0A251TVC9_HELAN|nr:hypothetical protein HanXRQr2_Chr09g0381491 [Helianthus annuus]